MKDEAGNFLRSVVGKRQDIVANFNRAFKDRWRQLINGFWFIPMLIALLGPLLALIFLALDHALGQVDRTLLFSGGAAEASVILSTIAGALITVIALTFSITILVLQMVSSQYTPRALRGFLQDRVTQIVAGSFFAISTYCLIVLTTIPDSSSRNPNFFPTISITVAMMLGLFALVLLLIFIHHTGSVIQVTDITARIASQTIEAMDVKYQTLISEPFEAETIFHGSVQAADDPPVRFCAIHAGYVQRIVYSHLETVLHHPGIHVHLLVCPGDFVTEETSIAEIWPAEAADPACRKAIFDSVYIERERDFYQDPRFGVRQLADISLRALSPAVNDPTTAALCIRYLQAVFEHYVRCKPQPNVFHMANGSSILEIRQPTFREYIEVFLEIGHYTGGNIRINNTLLTALQKIIELAEQLGLEEYQIYLAELKSKMVTQLS
ncbi:MAG TPA: DUF2254 domain-containing protein [Ktedonobacteraceae bacterium]|nr:DUF2254 domain-containing protein [Ktedonobacteraceae bacterium]